MAKSYNIALEGEILRVGFGEPAQNDQIVRDCAEALKALALQGGPVIKINGPASLPVAMGLAHSLGHIYAVVACFDPKMSKYVVSITHDPAYSLGDLID